MNTRRSATTWLVLCVASLACGRSSAAEPLRPGESTRRVKVGTAERSYLLYVPKKYDPKSPTPVVLAFHGASTNGRIMQAHSGLNEKADEAGFLAVYPNGTGAGETSLVFNAGLFTGAIAKNLLPDDVAFTGKLLDDLAGVANVDAKRVFATGLSNGGMMCHRLAGELSDRIAAIAPVAGTLCVNNVQPKRPVPVLHIHGLADTIVPPTGPDRRLPAAVTFLSVDETIRIWVKVDGCPEKPVVDDLPDRTNDGTRARRKTYGPGKDGAEVVLIEIDGGGHSWPGRAIPLTQLVLGRTSTDFSANDVIWEFFQKHPMK